MWEIAVRQHWFVSVIVKKGTGLKESLLSLFSYLNATASLQKAFVKNMFIMYVMLTPLSQLYKQLQNTINQSINHTKQSVLTKKA